MFLTDCWHYQENATTLLIFSYAIIVIQKIWQLPFMSDAYFKADESEQNYKKAQLKREKLEIKVH